MIVSRSLLCTGLLAAMLAPGSIAFAQQAPADRDDAALLYAQCVRDNGYAEFPDPEPDGFRFLIAPGDVARFKKAAAACQGLAPDGMRDEGVTPEALDALLKLAQCVRENGVTEFPDPTADGRFDLQSTNLKPGDTRLEAAMAACREEAGPDVRINIGG
jgi:hypothetical protein